MPLFKQTSLGRRSGPPEFEALREEVHRFDENQDTDSDRTLNRLFCSVAMRKLHDLFLTKISSSELSGRPDTKTPASSAGVVLFRMRRKKPLSERPTGELRCGCRHD